MHRIISQQKSFRVAIDGFGALPSRRIFMRIANQQPFTQLAASLQVLDQYLKSYGCTPSKLIQQPLLALTSPLPPAAFEQLAAQYVNKVAQPFFELSTVTLIRKEHALDKGKQVSVFGLQTL
jgi:2'-5' RNA ligase